MGENVDLNAPRQLDDDELDQVTGGYPKFMYIMANQLSPTVRESLLAQMQDDGDDEAVYSAFHRELFKAGFSRDAQQVAKYFQLNHGHPQKHSIQANPCSRVPKKGLQNSVDLHSRASAFGWRRAASSRRR